MQRTRAVVLVMCSVAIVVASWGSAATAGTAAKKKPKVQCDPKTAVKDIEPLFDINSNTQNSLKTRLGSVQFGNLKAVQAQLKAVDANNPVADVRAKPIANIAFPDKRSATGDLTIVFGGGANTLDQHQQFFMCVGKDQNGTKKGAWRITLFSLCNLYQLNPCSDALVNKALGSLTPALKKLTTP